eukprot:6781349-Prorocentrum_lima.AAC.1
MASEKQDNEEMAKVINVGEKRTPEDVREGDEAPRSSGIAARPSGDGFLAEPTGKTARTHTSSPIRRTSPGAISQPPTPNVTPRGVTEGGTKRM